MKPMPDCDSVAPNTVKRIVQQFVGSQLAVSPWVVASTALVFLACLGASKPAFAAPLSAGSVAGVVRDVSGTPQIGIVVELLRSDATLAARVFTDRKGNYAIASVLPGQYSLKAMGGDFIPTLKQNLRIRANTVVDLTLSSLYDLMQFVPPPRRVRPRAEDDWAWTLRSAQNRPLLRWQDDGSPIMVWDGAAETSETRRKLGRRRVRLQAVAGERRFGAGGKEISVSMLRDASARRRLAMTAEIAPDESGLMDAMVGMRQEMASSGLGSSSVQTLLAVTMAPEMSAGAQQGMQEASMRSWESLQLLNSLDAEAGSDQVLARIGDGPSVLAALPFASVALHRGDSTLEYRVATARTADPEAGDSMPGSWLPLLSERDGQLLIEHGLHQELGWSTAAGPAEMQLVIYGDTLENPILEASGRLSATGNAGGWVLADGASGLLRAAGPAYSAKGVMASVESRLPGNNRVRLSYASGDALVMQATATPESVASILQSARAHHAQMYSLMVSGTVDGLGTRWRASYRWQPESTVTEVAPYAVSASDPYLNVSIRQPIHVYGEGATGVEAQLDLRNLLAEGYQPFLTSDGSHLYFAQAQRCVRGGLAFTF
jgi:hypothetical protein